MCRVPSSTGTNLSTPELASLFDRVAEGPSVYGSLGWNFGSASTIRAGEGWCGVAGGRRDTVAAHFPCLLLKAIYITESNWRQFCSTGRTVIAFDCGYGIAQVTSGMRPGDTSAFDPNRVAAEPAYNVSVGAAILAGKWAIAPCVGTNDPDVVEHWYFATWGYNGFAFKNNPNNPMYRANRPEFRTPGVTGSTTRGNYPYQEIVWGYAHYPPSAAHYTGVALGYPDPANICADCGRPTTAIPAPAITNRLPCGAWADAGANVDAGQDVVTDTGVDTGTDTGPDARPGGGGIIYGGCGCRTIPRTASSHGIVWLAFAAIALASRARSRR
jgi:hypothetical protein